MPRHDHPESIDYLGGCLMDFLDKTGSAKVVLACGECSLIGFCDADGITNTVDGHCKESLFASTGMMTTNNEDEPQTTD